MPDSVQKLTYKRAVRLANNGGVEQLYEKLEFLTDEERQKFLYTAVGGTDTNEQGGICVPLYKFLLDNDVDPTVLGLLFAGCWSALHAIGQHENIRALEYIIQINEKREAAGKTLHDLDKARGDGITPLFMAAAYGRSAVVKVLVKAGADANKARNDGTTPLWMAAQKGYLDVVIALLAAGADVDKACNSGATPLFMAMQEGRLDVIIALIEAGANVDKANKRGATPLLLAAQEGHLDVVKALLAAGADANKARNDGTTPLFMAACNEHSAVVKVLVKAGANVDKANVDGTTPLAMATVVRHKEAYKTLRLNGAVDGISDKYPEINEFIENPIPLPKDRKDADAYIIYGARLKEQQQFSTALAAVFDDETARAQFIQLVLGGGKLDEYNTAIGLVDIIDHALQYYPEKQSDASAPTEIIDTKFIPPSAQARQNIRMFFNDIILEQNLQKSRASNPDHVEDKMPETEAEPGRLFKNLMSAFYGKNGQEYKAARDRFEGSQLIGAQAKIAKLKVEVAALKVSNERPGFVPKPCKTYSFAAAITDSEFRELGR